MSRNMTNDMDAEIVKPLIRPVLFVELDFLSAPVNLWGGIGPIDWDGKEWTGAGDLLGIGEIEEATDGTATTVTGTLRGVPSDLTGAIYQDEWQGRSAYAWLGMFDEAWGLVDDPVMIRQGTMDRLADADDGQSATFALVIQTEALDQGNNRSWRLTNEIQQQFFPGDRALEYTVALQAVPLRWGATNAPVRTIATFLQSIF